MVLDSFRSILITGGTGSFGRAFLKKLLYEMPNFKRIIVYSRDELKQWELQQKYPRNKFPQMRFFLGDIRDLERLKIAFNNVDVVIHAAALKQVPAAEYNPIEFIKTNVIGAQNIIEAAIYNKVKKVIALSTDKAAAPVNLYGASKLCSDKLFIAANNIKGNIDIDFSVVRYGNVMGSRGSVIPFFLSEMKKGVLPITDERMTRFNITISEGVEMVISALINMLGGEIFVPKIPSYKILDVAEAIGPNCKKKIIGIRAGEKIHEEMITKADSENTLELNNGYLILPSENNLKNKYFEKFKDVKEVKKDFSYISSNNKNFLNIDEIRSLIIKNVDKNFTPR